MARTIFQETIADHARRIGQSERFTRNRRRVLERQRQGQDRAQIRREMGATNCPSCLLDMSIEELEQALGVEWAAGRYRPREGWTPSESVELAPPSTPPTKEELARRGYTLSAPPFGYTKDGQAKGLAVVIEAEAALVRDVFSLYLDHGWTMAQIADELNADAGRPPRRNGGRWDKDAVREMLSNPYYAGYVLYRGVGARNAPNRRNAGTLYPGRHEALVSWRDFESVQQARCERRSSGDKTPWECPWTFGEGERE